MKGSDIIYILTVNKAQNVVFSDPKSVISVLGDIAYKSESQGRLTENLTVLRSAAIAAGHKREFDEALAIARQEYKNDDLQLKFTYTAEDFASSEEPYHEVFMQPTKFLQKRALDAMAAEAQRCGFRGFKQTYKAYVESLRQIKQAPEGSLALNPTDFPGQPIELEAGEWNCDATGVSRTTYVSTEYACKHPILPVERLVNIDTGEEKLRIAYSKGKYWRDIIVGKKELFDASKIIQLAAVGVSVTSKTAKALSEFMCDIEAMNYDLIPEKQSVSRLGYIGDGDNFSPYVDGLTFDGAADYSRIYSAITQHGSYDKWLEVARKCRGDNTTAQIMLAASFASPLISRVGCLSFFVHLWGIESGTGKTVALMLAASVWGDPAVGQYIQTFNATQVGHEKTAAFLNNIPMCIDELQLSKDSHGRSRFDVYQLSQGVGRTRGTKSGGIEATPTWALCILTTGESPIVNDNAGAGAVNRVIDIECRAADSVIKDGFGTSTAIKQNYGFAGRKFIEALTPEVIEEAKQRYEALFRELSSGETTEKQAMAAAMLILADELADRFIYHTGKALTANDLSEYLKSKSSVSAGERGYAYMCDWVSSNSNRFLHRDGAGIDVEPQGEVYGLIEGDTAYINKSVFRKAAKEQGFDDRALLSWLRTKGLIQSRGRAFTICKRVHGVRTECVAMEMPCDSDEFISTDDFEELLP